MKYLLLALIQVIRLFFGPVQAQKDPFAISGKVLSVEESYPLEGVTVQVKKTKNITGTMQDGAFSLTVAKGDTIVVSLDGYITREFIVSDETYYEIQLKRSQSPSFGVSAMDPPRLKKIDFFSF